MIRSIAQLSAAEHDLGAAELEKAYGGPVPLSVASRLCRHADGRWLLSFRHFGDVPASDLTPGDEFDIALHGLNPNVQVRSWIKTDVGPIDEVLAKLRSGVEHDVTRIERIWAAQTEHREADRQRFIAEQAAKDAAESARQRRAVEFRRTDWNALPELAQALYVAAMALDAGASPAKALRSLAEDVAKGGRRVFPDARWWD